MKEVIERVGSSTVFSDSVSDEKYYGVDQFGQGNKGWVGRSHYQGEMRVFGQSGISRGNGWDHLANTKKLKLFIDDLIKNEFKVYEFDTYQGLFSWLAE